MNYKYLHYLMEVAKSGNVMRASEQLHLTPQTISGQIQTLEEVLGHALFAKSGRGWCLPMPAGAGPRRRIFSREVPNLKKKRCANTLQRDACWSSGSEWPTR